MEIKVNLSFVINDNGMIATKIDSDHLITLEVVDVLIQSYAEQLQKNIKKYGKGTSIQAIEIMQEKGGRVS